MPHPHKMLHKKTALWLFFGGAHREADKVLLGLVKEVYFSLLEPANLSNQILFHPV